MLSTTLLLAASVVVGQAEEQAETPLHDFGEVYVGSWVGDITLIADWPGRNKKQGDEVPGYMKSKWAVGRNAIVEEGAAAGAAYTTIYVWDPLTKKIRSRYVDTGGSTWGATFSKAGDNWEWEVSGCLNDGTPLKGEGVWAVQDGGNRLVLEGEVFLGDEKLPTLRDVYTRLTKCHCEGPGGE
jgi:hypothetical protein